MKSAVDSTHQSISSSILDISHRIDSFFGTQRGDEETNGSRLRLFYDTSLRQHEKMDNGLNVRFSLRLPTLQNLLKFKYEKKAKEQEKTPSEQTRPTPSKRSFLKELSQKWTFNFSTGVRVDFPPNVFARARLRKTFNFFDKWEFNPTAELNWFSRGGWGALYSNDLDRKLTESTLLRIVNTFVWNNDANEITSTHGPQVIQKIDESKGISYNALASGSNRPVWAINNYRLATQFRHRVYSNWLFYEIVPAVDFPRERQWSEVYSVFIRLEALFGAL